MLPVRKDCSWLRRIRKVDRRTRTRLPRTSVQAIRMLEGRWKLVILFHLFGGRKLRFSDLERAIPAISQKMLIQQLRQLERDGIVARIVHAQVPPKVEYHLTKWGQSLCPALDELLTWAERQPSSPSGSQSPRG
jgi:DNA-binding HxlR family transcriptional regulator